MRQALALIPLLLTLSPVASAAEYSETIYDVSGILEHVGDDLEPNMLAEILINFAGEPEDWGAPALVVAKDGKLVVKQTAAVHKAIKALLDELGPAFAGRGKTVAKWKKLAAKEKEAAIKARSESDKAAYEALSSKEIDAKFEALSVSKALDAIREASGLSLKLEPDAKELAESEAVLVNLEQKASVLEVLEALLEGEGMEEMDFKVADGGIVIGMSYELHELVVRVYDVREFATLGVEPDELIEELESEIDSEDGALEYVAGLLLVLKIESAQDDVLALLEEIRDRE